MLFLNLFFWWRQAVLDSEQGRVVGAAIDEIVNGVRRAKFNRFVPQAYLPLSNLPPPKVWCAKYIHEGSREELSVIQ